MDVETAVRRVEASALFSAWKEKNPGYYLSNVFFSESGPLDDWQVSYYDEATDRIVTFTVEPLAHSEPQEVFKPHGTVAPLEMKTVGVGLEEAHALATRILADNFANEQVVRTIAILQRLDVPLYNFTFVTRSFNIINLKIDAASGLLKSQNVHSVLDLGQRA